MVNIVTKSLKHKIIALALFTSLSTIIIVGVLSYRSGRMALEEAITNDLISIAGSRERAIVLLLRLRMEQIDILAVNVIIQELMGLWNRKEEGQPVDNAALKNRFEDFVQTELPEFNQVAASFYDYTFIGEKGKVYFSTDESLVGKDFSQDERFKRGLKEKFLADVSLDSARGEPYRSIIVPIFSHEKKYKEPIGVMIVKTQVEALNEITINRKGLGETGEVYIVNKDGYMLTESRFIKDAVLKQKVDTEPIRLFQREKKIMAGVYPDYRGIPVLGASMGDEIEEEFGLGWIVLAEIDAAEAFAPIYKLRFQIAFFSLFIVISAILISFLLADRISMPIKEITGLAKAIAQGKLDTEVEIKTKDEIGQLAQSFNQMVKYLKERDALKVTKADLEKVVAQRTEELEGLKNNLEIEVEKRTQELEESKKSLEERVNALTQNDRAMLLMLEDLKQSKQVLAKKTEELEKSSSELRLSQLAAMNMLEDLSRTKEALEKAQVELEKWNKTLEEKVETRTRELKEAQEKMVRSEKLAAIGALSAGLGHELRNPLGAMKNACYYVKRKVLMSDLAKEDQRIPEFLEIIENEIGASDKIITDLLTFSRTGKPAFRPSEVNTIIDGALYLAKTPQDIKVDKRLKPDLPKAMVDPDQIRQVFLNIILNAFQSMPEGGSLTVATRIQKTENREQSEFIEVSFKDTGCGIKKEDLGAIFEPLFTTKAKGIGLGLAVTKAIMEKHEGAIEIESAVGEGTTFIIKLPVAG